MNDSVLVNQVYLIFNRPQFLVDSSETICLGWFMHIFKELFLFLFLVSNIILIFAESTLAGSPSWVKQGWDTYTEKA